MYDCGIDVAKRKHAIALLDEYGQPVQRPFTIDNTRAGFDQLRQAFAHLARPVLIGLEATGHYWWALYEELTRPDRPVVVLNALQVHAFRKSGVRKVKSDRTDASWIAEFLRFSQPQSLWPPESGDRSSGRSAVSWRALPRRCGATRGALLTGPN